MACLPTKNFQIYLTNEEKNEKKRKKKKHQRNKVYDTNAKLI